MASKYVGMQSNPGKYGTPHKPAPPSPKSDKFGG